ncbi:peptidase dimerization domain-containing protein [Streptacidiphilus monticola]
MVLRGAVDLTVTVELPDRRRRHGPDAPAALLRILNALRDGTGAPCLPGLPVDGNWSQEDWDEGEFRQAAGVLPGVALTGTGSVADRLWARPALTVTGIDGPPATGAGTARARINLRIPPGTEADSAAAALVARIRQSAPGAPASRSPCSTRRARTALPPPDRCGPRSPTRHARSTGSHCATGATAARSPCAARWPRRTQERR